MTGHGRPSAAGGDRPFGLVMAGALAAWALWPLLSHGGPRWWGLGLGLMFMVLALLRPGLLAPLNRLWTVLGQGLHRMVSPVALLLVFCAGFVLTGWVMRLLRKDPLRRAVDSSAASYWIERQPHGRADAQMRRQF
jgi:hypothetical protein